MEHAASYNKIPDGTITEPVSPHCGHAEFARFKLSVTEDIESRSRREAAGRELRQSP